MGLMFEKSDTKAMQPKEQETKELKDHVIIMGYGRAGQLVAQVRDGGNGRGAVVVKGGYRTSNVGCACVLVCELLTHKTVVEAAVIYSQHAEHGASSALALHHARNLLLT